MAAFNPQIPDTNDPNWLGWSKPISDPKPDLSKSTAIEGITSAVEGGLKLADYTYKSVIDDQVHAQVDQERQKYTSDLEKTDITTRIAAAAKTGKPIGEILPTDQSEEVSSQAKVPGELEKLPNTLGTLDNARGNGKLSETAYDGRLVAIAKDLRSRYPGYRDYIDQEMKKVSGRDSANQYIKGLLGDINSFVNAGKSELNKIRNEVWQAGVGGYLVDADKHLAALESGAYGPPEVAGPKIMSLINAGRVAKYNLELQTAVRKEKEGRREDVKVDVEDEANKFAAITVGNHFGSMELMSGVTTPKQQAEFVERAANGQIKVDPTQLENSATSIQAAKLRAGKAMDDYFNQAGPDGRSRTSILGKARIQEIKDLQLAHFDHVTDLIKSEKFGLAFQSASILKNMLSTDTLGVLSSDELGQIMRMSRVASNAGLDQYTEALFKTAVTAGLADKYQKWSQRAGLLMSTQPDIRTTGGVETLKKQVDDLEKRVKDRNNGIIPESSKVDVAKSYDQLVRQVEGIADPKVPDVVKVNLIKAAFSKEGRDLISKFERDGYDPATGKQKAGQYSIFNRLTKPDITSAVYKLKGSDPTLWDDYKSWATLTFGREMIGNDMKDLGRLQDTEGVTIAWNQKGYFEQPKFTEPKGTGFAGTGTFYNPVGDRQKKYITQTVNKINGALANLTEIAKADGSDINAYLLTTLKGLGLDYEKTPGLPQKIIDSIIQSKVEKQKVQDKYRVEDKPGIRDRALPYTEETPSGSLSEFLSAPASTLPARRNNAPMAFSEPRRGISNARDWAPNVDISRREGLNSEADAIDSAIRNGVPLPRRRPQDGPIMGIERSGSSNEDFGRINPAYSR